MDLYGAKDQYDHTAHYQRTQATPWNLEDDPPPPVALGRLTLHGGDYGPVDHAGNGNHRTDRTVTRGNRYDQPRPYALP